MMSDYPQFAPVPTTLLDVSRMARHSGYPAAMKELIDHLIRMVQWRGGVPILPIQTFADEPIDPGNPVLRAHLGGMAEHIAGLSGHAVPVWCLECRYFLDAPHFVGGKRAHPFLLETTPAAFSRRNLFCGPVLEKLARMPGR